MAPKKRPAKRVRVINTLANQHEPPPILSKEALDDLHYIEPLRTRKRVVSILNELFLRMLDLERKHQAPEH